MCGAGMQKERKGSLGELVFIRMFLGMRGDRDGGKLHTNVVLRFSSR